ncbi:hypothetical protein HLB23_14175 [Nocardia uniformis]|uniref:Uncharacterized protein n=1 Tax=Nocardia uniformis TaxID=53432 RepID=A0A849C0L4_9NOCA|nr:hypothetical protein [Nocardia uniformis]NNH70996.1 hypothetical protein [Nocardia uniformis]
MFHRPPTPTRDIGSDVPYVDAVIRVHGDIDLRGGLEVGSGLGDRTGLRAPDSAFCGDSGGGQVTTAVHWSALFARWDAR